MTEELNSNGIRKYGPGKFDTMLDAYVYELSLNGCDDEAGEAETCGWYGILRGIQIDGPFCDVGAAADLTSTEIEVLRRDGSAGVILHEDSQGFVDISYFSDEDFREKTWRAIERRVAKFEDSQSA